MAGHATGNRVNGKLHLHAFFDQQLCQFPDLVLGLRHRHAVAGNDDDLAGIGHHDASVLRLQLFHGAAAFHLFTDSGWAGAKAAEKDISH